MGRPVRERQQRYILILDGQFEQDTARNQSGGGMAIDRGMGFVVARHHDGGHPDRTHDIVFHAQHRFAGALKEDGQPVFHNADVLGWVHAHQTRLVGGIGQDAFTVLLGLAHGLHAALFCRADELLVIHFRQSASREVAAGDPHEQQTFDRCSMTLVEQHGQASAGGGAANEGGRGL